MKGGVERSTRGTATAAQTLTDIQNGVAERTVQKDLEALHRKKVNGATRNAVLFGPTDSNNQPSALSAGLNPLDLKVNGAVIPITVSFAKGFDKDTGPVDTVVSITADETVNLPALDANTVPIRYTDTLCTDGAVISGGDQSGVPKEYAITGPWWYSSQQGTAVTNTAYIGYAFAADKHIRRISFAQGVANASVTSILVQNSIDGITWTDVQTFNNIQAVTINMLDVQYSTARKYWRLLAKSATATATGWAVTSLKMMEALETFYVYAEKVGDHGYQLGYTKQKPRYDVESDTYTDNLCKGGLAISGGDLAGYAKGEAFDDIVSPNSDYWQSLQSSSHSGNAYIGYDFGASKDIRLITIIASGSVTNQMPNIKVQYSDNGSAWNDAITVGFVGRIEISSMGAHRYWRLLANANISGNWIVHEISMHELATDQHFYDQVAETMNYFNGTAWEQKERVFIGEAYTTITALYGYKTYDYDAARLNVAPATLVGMPVNLGQFANLLAITGWQQLPGGLILQWGRYASGAVGPTITFPIPFPNVVFGIFGTPDGSNSMFGVQSVTVSSFIGNVDKYDATNEAKSFYWIAIGY